MGEIQSRQPLEFDLHKQHKNTEIGKREKNTRIFIKERKRERERERERKGKEHDRRNGLEFPLYNVDLKAVERGSWPCN